VNFILTILGSSSALPTSKRFPTAHLLNVNERFFLIDCGEGTQIQLRKFKTKFTRINHIFISHSHGDHVFGLFGLLSSFNLLGRKADLHIYGPAELKKMISFFQDNFRHGEGFNIVLHDTGQRGKKRIYEDKNIEVFSFPLKHRIPTTGFLFIEKEPKPNLRKDIVKKYNPGIENIANILKGGDLELEDGTMIPHNDLILPKWKKRSYAYCSDTAFYPSIKKYIKDVNLLYHESTFSEDDKELAKETMHSTAMHAAEIAKMVNAGKLLIGHFSNRYKNIKILEEEARSVFPETFAVNDGDSFMLERCRESQ